MVFNLINPNFMDDELQNVNLDAGYKSFEYHRVRPFHHLDHAKEGGLMSISLALFMRTVTGKVPLFFFHSVEHRCSLTRM